MINKTMLKEFRGDFTETVKDLEKKYGIKLELGNINFDSSDFRTKLIGTNVGNRKVDPTVNTNNPNTLIGKTILLRGTKYTITNYKSNRPKYPYVIESPRGASYKVTKEQVMNSLI